MRSLIQVSPVLRLHAPTRGLSQLAAPFFSSQAEPFSRRRGMSGRLVVFVWRLVKTFRIFLCASLFVACAWCHFEFRFFLAVQFTLRAASCVGAALHLFLMTYPMLLDCFRSCFGQYKVIASESFKDFRGGRLVRVRGF